MTSPIYYRFSEDGYFENSVHAAPDPLASKREGHAVFIQPHSSTLVAPDELEGKWAKWTGENWDYVTLPKTVDELIAFGKIKHDLVDGWWELTKIPEPTAEEIQAQIARDARSKRDYLISQTDYLLQPDYPISAEQLEEVKAYRQALRDVPEQDGFPETIVWPEMPTVTALK